MVTALGIFFYSLHTPTVFISSPECGKRALQHWQRIRERGCKVSHSEKHSTQGHSVCVYVPMN